MDGARARLLLRDATVLSTEAIHTVAHAIMAVALLVAVGAASFQRAVVSSKAWVASTVSIDAGAIARAVAWADDGSTVISTIARTAVAGAVVAVALGMDTVDTALPDIAVIASETLVTHTGTIDTCTMVGARVRARLHHGITLNAGEPLSTEAAAVEGVTVLALDRCRGFGTLEAYKTVFAKALVANAISVHA